jgi:hypothetical protein
MRCHIPLIFVFLAKTLALPTFDETTSLEKRVGAHYGWIGVRTRPISAAFYYQPYCKSRYGSHTTQATMTFIRL